MKNNYFKNTIKFGIAAVLMMAIGNANAQSSSDQATTASAVKLIDNKGTIKYVQSNNGITTITNTTSEKTTTTFQLGGTLVDDTNIATGTNEFKITVDGAGGGTFVIDGLLPDAEGAATAFGGTGYSLLVRDESDGQVKNILATDLIDVVLVDHDLGADTSSDIAIPVPGVLTTTNISRVSVYRNGVKLREFSDYSVPTDGTVEVVVANIGGEGYNGDVFEVQWIK
ncbi:hypothetical protein [Urechidicola vernalis]|uniref:Uncharacterized protein n=1 Tax=Urechidicola vernalis TaxID=3075600 RepID=A0ABU2Y7U0_9FLAO|nr:hypothetical protein [Urechidicola sp. P050]MDT0554274.1 hypothetical protein [Urechidicola sp. P050]